MQTEELQASCSCVNIRNPFIRESYMMLKMFPDITSEIHSVLAQFSTCGEMHRSLYINK